MRSPSSRVRLLLVALALGAAAPAPAAVATGSQPAPATVSVTSSSAAHWMPGNRWLPAKRAPRIAAPIGQSPASAPVAAAPRPPAAAAGTAANLAPQHAGSYSFMAESSPGQPIRWDPCQTVRWVFNPAGAPAGGLAVLERAVDRISATTGLRFAYAGTTTAVPTGSYVDSQTIAGGFRPLLTGWSTPAASSLLANQSANLVGMNQTIWLRPASGPAHIVSGVVALNARVTAPTSGSSSWYTFALHELGHAVGLGHTADATQVMAPTIPANATDFGSGDLAGLAKVGGTC